MVYDEKHMDTKKVALVLGIVVVALAAVFIAVSVFGPEQHDGAAVERSPEAAAVDAASAERYTFTCPDGKTFVTAYSLASNTLTLELEGGTSYLLEQAVTASGARYESKEDKVVFWEHQGKAMVEVDGQRVHDECTTTI